MTLPPIILSVALGEKYIEQQSRLAASIARTNPDVHTKHWTNEYPPGSSAHLDSLYGFKVHAVKWAIDKGYQKIIWLDTACILQHSVMPWFDLNMPPMIAIKDDTKLQATISKRCLMFYSKVSIDDRLHLVGGSLYVFDFKYDEAVKVFGTWQWAERVGAFGSQELQSVGLDNRHRHDESNMAMCMDMWKIEPLTHEQARYNTDESSIVIKRHFK